MTFKEYQSRAGKLAFYPRIGNNLEYPVLGLCGEAGEIANKVKKIQRDRTSHIDAYSSNLVEELGDVLWYVQQLATELGTDMETVALINIEKLESRADRGKLAGNGDSR